MLSVPASRCGSIAAPASSSSSSARRCRAVHAPPDASRLERQREVFGDREMWKQRRLLVDDGDAERSRQRRRHVRNRSTGHRQAAFVGLLGAAHDFDERRFSGAVLPDERVDLALPQVE